jgi:TatD DNase family protein
MLDGHCHLDRYEDPKATAAEAVQRGVFTIAVTNLPSHFRIGLPHVRGLPRIRLALGLHPLAVADQVRERELFRELLGLTSFVGEVGLDFSREGRDTRDSQLASFRFVAQCIGSDSKVVSLHSRHAESAVLEILTEFKIPMAIFHWYSGSLSVLDKALSRGHFFSVNPAMVRSEKGKRIIGRIPLDRLLTETDGPYVKINGVSARPWDTLLVENHLSLLWNIPLAEVRKQIWSNFQAILNQLGLAGRGRIADVKGNVGSNTT